MDGSRKRKHEAESGAETDDAITSSENVDGEDGESDTDVAEEKGNEDFETAEEEEEKRDPEASAANVDDEESEPTTKLLLARALMPWASTSGFVQYGTGGKGCPVDGLAMQAQKEMLASVLKALGTRRLTQSTARQAMAEVLKQKGFPLEPSASLEASTELAKRLQTMLSHYKRAKAARQSPPWLRDVEAHIADAGVLQQPAAATRKRPAAFACKRPAADGATGGSTLAAVTAAPAAAAEAAPAAIAATAAVPAAAGEFPTLAAAAAAAAQQQQ